MCSVINNADPSFPGNFQRALETFDSSGDGLIDLPEFTNLNKHHPMLLWPAFRMQDRMQKATLGEAAWTKINRSKARRETVIEYEKSHDGAAPPESLGTRLRKMLLGPSKQEKMAQYSENAGLEEHVEQAQVCLHPLLARRLP